MYGYIRVRFLGVAIVVLYVCGWWIYRRVAAPESTVCDLLCDWMPGGRFRFLNLEGTIPTAGSEQNTSIRIRRSFLCTKFH